jgi:hypothetical protein
MFSILKLKLLQGENMRVTIIIACIAVCALILLSCGEKHEKYAVLTGRVTASDTSAYLADVKVFEKSHKKLSTFTDSLGFFRLDDVSCKEHNIYFEKEGYEPEVLNFEYTGNLQHPLITRHVIMYKPGEERIPLEEKIEDTLKTETEGT